MHASRGGVKWNRLYLDHHPIDRDRYSQFVQVCQHFLAEVSQNQLPAMQARQIGLKRLVIDMHAGLFAVERTFAKKQIDAARLVDKFFRPQRVAGKEDLLSLVANFQC